MSGLANSDSFGRIWRGETDARECSIYTGVIESYNTIINARSMEDYGDESDESARRALPADSSGDDECVIEGAVGGASHSTGNSRDRPFSRSSVRNRAVATVAPVVRRSPADSVPATSVAQNYVPLRRPAEALPPSLEELRRPAEAFASQP